MNNMKVVCANTFSLLGLATYSIDEAWGVGGGLVFHESSVINGDSLGEMWP